MEHHNLRQIVLYATKEIVAEETQDPTRNGDGDGPSSLTRHSQEEIDNARRTLDLLTTEEQRAGPGRDLDDEEEAEVDDQAEYDNAEEEENENEENNTTQMLPEHTTPAEDVPTHPSQLLIHFNMSTASTYLMITTLPVEPDTSKG